MKIKQFSLIGSSQSGFAFIPIMIIVAALVMVGGGGTVIYQIQKQNKAENDQLRNEIAELKEAMSSPSEEPEEEKEEPEDAPEPTPAPSYIPGSSLRFKVPLAPAKPMVPLEVKAGFIKECESQYRAIYSEALTPPVALIEAKRDTAEKACAEGSTYNRMESYWYCNDRTAYVQTLEGFVDYCVDWKTNRLNQ